MFSRLLLIAVIPVITSYVHLGHNCSAFFRLSFVEDLPKVARFGSFKADSELACASRCCAQKECTEAVFSEVARTCVLYCAKESEFAKFQADSHGKRTGYIRLKKVIIPGLALQDGGYSPKRAIRNTGTVDSLVTGDTTGNNVSWSSCNDILKQNRSNPSGYYNLTDGNNTWTTHCHMKNIPGCGKGAWTLVMKVSGSKNTFKYNSTKWRNKTPFRAAERSQCKLPGYWLSPINKICIKMRFQSPNTTISLVLNHTAQSLHSVLQLGDNHAMMEDSSSVMELPWSPTTLDRTCLKKGFNVIGPRNMSIKLRVGLVSQEARCSFPPFFARGVGFGLWKGFFSNITCGEIYSDSSFPNGPKVVPAFCKVYIQ